MRHALRGPLTVFCLALLALTLASPASGGEMDQYEDKSMTRSAERAAERTFRASRSDRTLWLKALEGAFPDKMTEKMTSAATDEEFGAWFDLLAGKNGEWRRDDTKNTQITELFDKVLQRLEMGPVPGIKREEFLKYAKHSLAPPKPGGQGGQNAPDPNDDADKVFRVLDRDSDGELTSEEFTLSLKEEKARTDSDGNGRITKEEYRDYFKRKVATKVDAVIAKYNSSGVGPDGRPVAKQVVTGDGLPDWFATLDEDKDKQVSLFEWRKGGRPLATFEAMDLDRDGLLTKDEYLRYVKINEDELKQKKREEEAKKP